MAAPPATNGLQSTAKEPASPSSPAPNSNVGLKSTSKPAPTTSKPAEFRKSVTPVIAGDTQGQGKRNFSQQRAWTSGTNPITRAAQQSQPSPQQAPQQNGSVAPVRPLQNSKQSTVSAPKQSSDRLIHLLGNLTGHQVTLTLQNGDKYQGIFAGIATESNETLYSLQMARKTKSSGAQNGVNDPATNYVGDGEHFSLDLRVKDVVDLSAVNVTLDVDNGARTQNGTSSFRTDTDISGNRNVRERPLQRWEPDAGTDMSLEGGSNSNNLGWDQFETNKRLYGVQSNYNENFYTTTINTSHPMHKQRVAEAERLAREIERESSTNSHVREERGHKALEEDGLNEEDKYSGVRRSVQDFPPLQHGGQSKYTPPARRAPTEHPTVRGAPVDPAIISSQLARSDSSGPRTETDKGPRTAPGGPEQTPESADKAASAESSSVIADSSSKMVAATKGKEPVKGKTQPTGGHTANVENEVRDAFKDFAKLEKIRVQERRRHAAKNDKDVRINDLLRFSNTFKLHTPVPKDLLSILARDPLKQEQISQTAARNAAESEAAAGPSGKKPLASLVDENKSQRASARHDNVGPNHNLPDKQSVARSARGPNANQSSLPAHQRNDRQALPSGPAPGPGLSQRLANLHNQNRAGPNANRYPNLTIQDSRGPPTGPAAMPGDNSNSQRSSGAPTPLSATSGRFNVKAMEFRPNPAASTFTPTGEQSNQSSPRLGANNRPASRHQHSSASPADFWGSRKPRPKSERRSIANYFNPMKRLKKEVKDARENKENKDPRDIKEENGGIPWAHKTLPRWDATTENAEKTYIDAFNELPTLAQIAPHPGSMTGPHGPHHQPQMPFQHAAPMVPTGSQHQHMAHHLHPNHSHHPGMPHQYDDHRMHYSNSNSSVYPSPRMPQANISYQPHMVPAVQMTAYQQYAPAGGIAMGAYRSFSGGGPQMAPHMPGPNGAPMMAQTPSNGPYMGMPQAMAGPFNQQMPMYGSPAQGHAYPHPGPPAMGPGGHNGYPSPGRGAPLMMHQGSQQGQNPQMMMAYGMSPAPQHHQSMYGPGQPGYIPGGMRGGYVPQGGQYAVMPAQQQQQQQHHHPMQHRGSSHGGYNP